MNKNIIIELAAEKPYEKGYCYARLGFPATAAEIEDLKHRARLVGREDAFVEVRVIESHQLKALVGTRIIDWSYKEFNFLAHRLQSMSDEALISLNAIFEKQQEEGKHYDGLETVELINMTYGHENVMVASYVTNLEQLGKFSIENGLYAALPEIPEIDPNLLNVRKVGELQQKADDGIFYDKYYVVAGEHRPQEVYTSDTVPDFESEETRCSVFSIALGKPTDSVQELKSVNKVWVHLPVEQEYFEKILKEQLDCPINEAVCYEINSAIPQINMRTFSREFNIYTLNEIASEYKKAREFDKIKFKAALEGHETDTLDEIYNVLKRISSFELAYFCDNAGDYFRDYLSLNMDGRFDDKWLEKIDGSQEGLHLMDRKGAAFTRYGIISNGIEPLFSPVPYDGISETQQESEDVGEEQTGGIQL